jgi:prolyl oligopeptidase
MKIPTPIKLLIICGTPLTWSAVTTPADESAPAAIKQPVSDTYHGVTVKDSYRWLEDSSDPRVLRWSAAQNQRARTYLDGLPYRQAIYDRLYRQISATSPSYHSLYAAGGKVFALYNQPPKNQPMIAVLGADIDPARARVVVDPNTLNVKGTTAVDWYVPSPDGALLAVSMSDNGSEDGSVHIFEVGSGKQVHEVLPRVQYPTGGGSLAWRADSKGFWYTRYPGTERPRLCENALNVFS